MWCPACRADVAAELSQDSHHFRCARCGVELGIAKGASGVTPASLALPGDSERSARELLARWSAQNQLAVPAIARAALPSESADSSIPTSRAAEIAQSSGTQPQSHRQEEGATVVERRRKKKRRIDRRVASDAVPAAMPILTDPPAKKSSSLGTTIGQICAYFGIGLITCGTSVVLWGFFGGPAHFAPTGWLVTTIGQMFLFLGVVTLISSSMEQTSADIASRMDALTQRLIRIELLQREQCERSSYRRMRKSHLPGESGELPHAEAA